MCASVDELSRQRREGLLKLEAFGDGLLLRGQALFVRGLAALAQGVGGHHDQLLLFLLVFISSSDGLRDALQTGLLRLEPPVLQTVFCGGSAPEETTAQNI